MPRRCPVRMLAAPSLIAAALLGACAPSREPSPPRSSNAPSSTTAPSVADGATGAGRKAAPPALSAGAAPPFENPGGMWMPEQIPEHAAELKALGVALDVERLATPTAYPLGSVVSLGGCSASFVSPEGLVITNHHCATSALQYNSTQEHNLMRDGYLAPSREAERWAGPTARVYVTQTFRDVTADVRAGLERASGDLARFRLVEDRTKRIVAACEKGRPFLRCSVASYFGGARYVLNEQLEIKDVRLVYAPSAQIGNYGGEIDNWRWPRHTGDFAFVRAYVGPDGKPADHAEKNVPYRPPQHLTLASKPLEQGNFVMVVGYPGTTSRLKTAAEVDDVVNFTHPRALERMRAYIDALNELVRAEPPLAIKATPSLRGLHNYLTKTQGMQEGLLAGGLLAVKQKTDADLQAWIRAEPAREREYGDLFAKLATVDAERRKTREHDAAFGEPIQFARLLGSALTIVRMREERAKPDSAREPAYQARNWQRIEQGQRQLQKTYDRAIDRALLELALRRALRLPMAERPEIVPLLLGRTADVSSDVGKAVEALYTGTELESETRRVALLGAPRATLASSRDPLIQLALKLLPFQRKMEDADKAAEGALTLLRPRYVTALRASSPGPLAPDANGTMRITYGTVRPYRPSHDAPLSSSFTVLAEVAAKHTGRDPFDAPPRLLQAQAQRRLGPYVASDLGDVPVDFLSDLDITNGNSGSPTLNDRGELVGLAFDGNIEAVASDYVFVPATTRTIHVDLRYILWVMDAVDHADALLSEMGVTPALH